MSQNSIKKVQEPAQKSISDKNSESSGSAPDSKDALRTEEKKQGLSNTKKTFKSPPSSQRLNNLASPKNKNLAINQRNKMTSPKNGPEPKNVRSPQPKEAFKASTNRNVNQKNGTPRAGQSQNGQIQPMNRRLSSPPAANLNKNQKNTKNTGSQRNSEVVSAQSSRQTTETVTPKSSQIIQNTFDIKQEKINDALETKSQKISEKKQEKTEEVSPTKLSKQQKVEQIITYKQEDIEIEANNEQKNFQDKKQISQTPFKEESSKLQTIKQQTKLEVKVEKNQNERITGQKFSEVEINDKKKKAPPPSIIPQDNDLFKYCGPKAYAPLEPFGEKEAEQYFSVKYSKTVAYKQALPLLVAWDKFRLLFDRLWRFGYDFRHKIFQFSNYLEGVVGVSVFRRKVGVLYICWGCHKLECESGRWIEDAATMEITYKIDGLAQFYRDNIEHLDPIYDRWVNDKNFYTKIDQDHRHPFMLRYEPVIYEQKCLKCGHWARPYIFTCQLAGAMIEFSQVIQAKMEGKPPKTTVVQNCVKSLNNFQRHNQSSCMACKKNVCLAAFYSSVPLEQ